MPREMLIVHESQLLRKIITGYVLSELSDLVVESAGSAQEGLVALEKKKYDVIVSALEMSGMDGLELFRRMRFLETNKDTPFVLTTSTDTKAQRRRVASAGIRHVLISPYTATDLARMVDVASDPREKRAFDRYSIPGVMAVFHWVESDISARVLNLSLKGVYCELVHREEYANPLRPFKLDLVFPEEYGRARVENILASVLRINVMNWRDDHTPDLVRLAVKFVQTPAAADKTLRMVLSQASRELSMTKDLLES
ncbi:MAG: response regulator [Thermodesulfobacteriota bacterium]